MTSPILRVVRFIRTFNLKESCSSRPYLWYFSICGVFITWANYAQYKRLKPMYPNYDEYRKSEGGRMLEAKRQEFADVIRYNNMVNTMRSDMGARL
ncbi:hypothetical protein, conserved [Trypanosoma brucei gambiense DAL972]|uniref:Uncharacterized protein n=2 Tax=Trypanosoma brucei TaxID=5691 RepID=C9ZQS9_TRYB9|nr:hypothetical protein, conserved [Trypanosoma brucei gambiense DAL972]RHW72043.1 hypothetical protein DPX39_060029200 [Trypanosoma brucei equiperdum]CBH11759.1 hypothetical protein, conserved [Trypanosoma brucei gambiense DAL972]|eukprot:XP_011774044.1 hypothetical protein, conserved [Trypanosoma brucei gambiense DAL972]